MAEFREMPLKPELIESLRRMGFVTATEVQEKSIPELMKGKNLIVRAKTGTGQDRGVHSADTAADRQQVEGR